MMEKSVNKRNKKQSLIFSIIFLILSAENLFANGGPVENFDIGKTGNVVFIEKSKVEILSEDLDIKINGARVYYKVRYVFVNRGKTEKIKFAFPVQSERRFWDDNKKDEMEFLKKRKFFDYKVAVNGQNISSEWKTEVLVGGGGDFFTIKEFFISEFEIKKRAQTSVEISYSADSDFGAYIYSCSSRPKINSRLLVYDFYPASYFGRGSVKKLNIDVDFTEVLNLKGKILKISGLKFKKTAPGKMNFKGVNVNFKKTRELVINYEINKKDKHDYYLKNRIRPENFVVKTTSSDEKGISSMFDINPETEFCLKNDDGVFKIHIDFKKGALPGFLSAMIKEAHKKDLKVIVDVKCRIEEKETFVLQPGKQLVGGDGCEDGEYRLIDKKECDYFVNCMDELNDLGDYDPTKINSCEIDFEFKTNRKIKEICIEELLMLSHN